MKININSDELVRLTNSLERLHKSALPVTVRGTLNDLAFEAKKKHVAKEFSKEFTVRSKTFIKSHTGVNKSPNTFHLRKMESSVGVIASKDAAQGLKAQETGGSSERSKYIPFEEARISKKYEKKVSKTRYLSKGGNLRKIRGPKNPFRSKKFIKTAISKGKGKYINYNGIISYIKKIKTRPLYIDLQPLYKETDKGAVKLQKRSFLEPAGKAAYQNVYKLFRERAKRKLNIK